MGNSTKPFSVGDIWPLVPEFVFACCGSEERVCFVFELASASTLPALYIRPSRWWTWNCICLYSYYLLLINSISRLRMFVVMVSFLSGKNMFWCLDCCFLGQYLPVNVSRRKVSLDSCFAVNISSAWDLLWCFRDVAPVVAFSALSG